MSSRDLTPTNLAFIAVESRTSEDIGDVRQLRHNWYRGAIIVERREYAKTTRQATFVTHDYNHFWSVLGERVSATRPLHIFAYDLASCLTLSRYWHLMYRRIVGISRQEVDFLPGKVPTERKQEWEGIICDNDPPVIISCWHRAGGRIHAVDVRNYWRDYVPTSVDCERQVEEIRGKVKSLLWWHRKEKLGLWGPTVSSLSMSAFRGKSKHADSITPSNVTYQRDFEREAVYGGRCEVFRIGRELRSVWQVDCNSLYPYVSHGLETPVAVRTEDALSWAGRQVDSGSLSDCIARVVLQTDRPLYPVRLEDRVAYPVGRFQTVLPGPELELARNNGHIVDILRARRYQCEPIFDDYMEWQRELRHKAELDHDKDGVLFAKMLGNSLWGKFAQRHHKWESVSKHVDIPEHMQQARPDELRWYLWMTEPVQGQAVTVAFGGSAKSLKLRQVGNHWQVKLPPGEKESAFPAIAAWVTSAARLEMLMLMELAGLGNVYHVATDALIVNADAMDRLADSGVLDDGQPGSLKTVLGPVDAEIVAPNWHRLGQTWTRAGLPSDAWQDEDGGWRVYTKESLESILARGITGFVNERQQRKWFVLSPGVGEVQADGWVSPLRLGE